MGRMSDPGQVADPGPPPDEIGQESTLQLLARARSGDEEAMDRLCRRCLPPLKRWASGRLPRWARGILDTDDIVQESLLQTVRNVSHFEPRHEGALQAYLHQAVLNQIRDRIRAAKRHPRPIGEPDSQECDSGPSPLEVAIGREALMRYERALLELRDEEREAIILTIEMGYSHDALAAALGKPTANAARMTLTRALVRLSVIMEGMTRA